jgi:hypothetical protein
MEMPKRRRTDRVVALPTIVPGALSATVTDRDIACRAYELYEERGRTHGHDLDDWLQAERELLGTLRSTAA